MIKTLTSFLTALLWSCAVFTVPTIEDELTIVYDHIHTIKNNDTVYTKREQVYAALRKKLLLNDENSRLFALSNLDMDTFNESIGILNKWFFNNESNRPVNEENVPYDNAALLHTWSFLSGIKVFGMREHGSYYYHNYHLKDRNAFGQECNHGIYDTNKNKPLKYTKTKIYRGDDDANPLPVMDSLVTSSVFFRSNFGHYNFDGMKERQVTVREFFQGSHFCPIESDLASVTEFLTSVLTLSAGNVDYSLGDSKPYYFLGIVKLLQNTAIYFSHDEESENKDSYVITSPCTTLTINYLGLQDGVFLSAAPIDGVERICRLMAYQVYYRAYHQKFPGFEAKKTMRYSSGSGLPFEEPNIVQNTKKDLYFSMRFAEFTLGKRGHGDGQTELYKSLQDLWGGLEKFQLKTPLKVKKERWFHPSEDVDIEKIIQDHEENNYSRGFNGSIIEHSRPQYYTYKDMVEHLCDPDYQEIKSLKVFGVLGNISVLSCALGNNILPNLRTLDLLDSRVTDEEIRGFFDLLDRPNFQYLVVKHHYFQPNFSEDKTIKLEKIIWLTEGWIKNLLKNNKITPEIANAHKSYYEHIEEKT